MDHKYIITKDGCIGVTIGYNHPNGGEIGWLAYAPREFLGEKYFSKKYNRDMVGKTYVKVFGEFIKNWKKQHYDKIMKYLSKSFPDYFYKDKFWGQINFFPNKKILRVIDKGNYSNNFNKRLLTELKKFFGLKANEIDIISTKSFGLNNGSDYDIMIKGLSASIKVKDKVRKLTKDISNQFITPKGTPHKRIFIYKNNKIDLFFRYKKNEEPLGKFSCEIKGYKRITDKVIDDTYSMFIPSIYKLEKNGTLITYFTKHIMLLKKGDIIQFRAREIKINSPKSKKFSGKGLLINSRGEWIKILNRSFK